MILEISIDLNLAEVTSSLSGKNYLVSGLAIYFSNKLIRAFFFFILFLTKDFLQGTGSSGIFWFISCAD